MPAAFTAGEVLSSADQNLLRNYLIAQIKEGQQANLERLKAGLKLSPIEGDDGTVIPVGNAFEAVTRSLGETMSKLDDTIKAVSAEKEIVRDEKGKVTGTRLKLVE